MVFVYYLFFGVFGTIIATFIPGLLNMYSAKISRTQGKKSAFLFATGVSIAIGVLTTIALVFARFLDKNPEVISILQKVALGIFISITIYFFFIAKDVKKAPIKEVSYSKSNLFFKGFVLSIINLLPIPYWVYISITFTSFNLETNSFKNGLSTPLSTDLNRFLHLLCCHCTVHRLP